MKPYHLHVHLDGFAGQYAQKYAVLLKDAHILHAALLVMKCNTLASKLESAEKMRLFDAFETFNETMKALKLAKKHGNQMPFYAGKQMHGERIAEIKLPGDDILHIVGTQAYIQRGEKRFEASSEDLEHVEISTVYEISKPGLTHLAMICEEGFARAMNLVIRDVDKDHPVPPPLFQL